MKTIFIYVVLFCGLTTTAQEYFFEFLPGWQNMKIIENDFNYISVGHSTLGIGLINYQFSSFSKTGVLLNEWEFNLDTIHVLQSRYTNDVSFVQEDYFISGAIKGNISDRFYGSFIKFNSDFSDTLRTSFFNILPGNGTQIRSHLAINNNKFILGGYLADIDFNLYPSFIEVDSLGNINWSNDFFCGSNCELVPYHILQASDGGYFFTCGELHNSGGSGLGFAEKTAIIKTDSLGNQQYRLDPGNPVLFARPGWVLPTDDGNYISAYSDPRTTDPESLPQDNPEKSIWLYKFDVFGTNIYEISLINFLPNVPGFEQGYNYTIIQMLDISDEEIIITGFTGLFGFLLKVTENGDGVWFRLFNPPQAEGNNAGSESTKILGITPTSDGGYIMAGEYYSSPGNIYPEGIQTAIAVKVDEYGCLEPGCQIGDGVAELTNANLELKLYPNPTNGKLNVSVNNRIKVKRISVYGVTGRLAMRELIYENNLQMDVDGLKAGIYLLEVETEDGFREVERLVIE